MSRKVIFSKDIVKKYNIPYSTVTHYTNLGFLNVVGRKGNKRLYDENEVSEQIAKISKLINEGYPLRLIRKVLLENLGEGQKDELL